MVHPQAQAAARTATSASSASVATHVREHVPQAPIPAHLAHLGLRHGSLASQASEAVIPARVANIRVQNGTKRTLRKQHNEHLRIQSTRPVAIDWDRIRKASLGLLEASALRSRVLRKIIRVAKSNGVSREDIDAQNVVYCVFHTKTSKFYIGETRFNAVHRLRQHWSTQKLAANGTSALSKFFINKRLAPEYSAERLYSELRIFVLKRCESEAERKIAETTIIRDIASSMTTRRLLLNEFVPKPIGRRRLRHRPYNDESPTNNQHPDPQIAPQLSAIQRIAAHLDTLSDENRFRALSDMKVKKLQQLNKLYNRGSQAKREVSDTIKSKISSPTSRSPKDFVFSWPNKGFAAAKTILRTCPGAKNVRLVAKLVHPVGLRVRTTASVAISSTPTLDDIAMETCDCHEKDAKFLVEGHVCTADFAILGELSDLRKLLEQGANYRTGCGLSKAVESFQESAYLLFDHVNPGRSEGRQKWVDEVTSTFERKLRSQGRPEAPFDMKKADEQLKECLRKFVIGGADKNANQHVVWCRSFYAKKLIEELNKAFTPVDTTKEELFLSLSRSNETVKCKSGDTLPYPYLLVKLHKLDTHRGAFRLIVGKSKANTLDEKEKDRCGTAHRSDTMLGKCRKQLSTIYNAVIDTLIIQDRAETVKKVWIMRQAQEFVDTIHALDIELRRKQQEPMMTTQDFTTLYTNLEHDDVQEQMKKMLTRAWQFWATKYGQSISRIKFARDGKFTANTKVQGWTLEQTIKAMQLSVSGSYILTNGKIMRQGKGIGMGNDDSPGCANLYLTALEIQYVEWMIENNSAQTIRDTYFNFKFHRRLIDDLFAPVPSNLFPQYGDLEKKTTYEGKEIVCIGVQVAQDKDRRLVCKARDKQHAFSFQLLRYPSWSTNCPRNIKIGTIIGMLSRTMALTTNIDDCKEESKHIVHTFQQRQYPESAIKEGVRKFIKRNVHPRVADEWYKALLSPYEPLPPPVNVDPVLHGVPPPQRDQPREQGRAESPDPANPNVSTNDQRHTTPSVIVNVYNNFEGPWASSNRPALPPPQPRDPDDRPPQTRDAASQTRITPATGTQTQNNDQATQVISPESTRSTNNQTAFVDQQQTISNLAGALNVITSTANFRSSATELQHSAEVIDIHELRDFNSNSRNLQRAASDFKDGAEAITTRVNTSAEILRVELSKSPTWLPAIRDEFSKFIDNLRGVLETHKREPSIAAGVQEAATMTLTRIDELSAQVTDLSQKMTRTKQASKEKLIELTRVVQDLLSAMEATQQSRDSEIFLQLRDIAKLALRVDALGAQLSEGVTKNYADVKESAEKNAAAVIALQQTLDATNSSFAQELRTIVSAHTESQRVPSDGNLRVELSSFLEEVGRIAYLACNEAVQSLKADNQELAKLMSSLRGAIESGTSVEDAISTALGASSQFTREILDRLTAMYSTSLDYQLQSEHHRSRFLETIVQMVLEARRPRRARSLAVQSQRTGPVTEAVRPSSTQDGQLVATPSQTGTATNAAVAANQSRTSTMIQSQTGLQVPAREVNTSQAAAEGARERPTADPVVRIRATETIVHRSFSAEIPLTRQPTGTTRGHAPEKGGTPSYTHPRVEELPEGEVPAQLEAAAPVPLIANPMPIPEAVERIRNRVRSE